jgi:methionine synthase / methylenetetrahydrofolate reductase(NADPH)
MSLTYLERITKNILLFDGAMGTMLFSKGVFVNQCFEAVCLSKPDLVAEVHKEYLEAGVEAITTNSFGANPVKLASYGLKEKTADINRSSVKIARDISYKDIYIAGSVGPLGVYIEPIGRLKVEEAKEAFRIQISALLEEGVDLIILETFSNIDELLLAASVAKELDANIPVQAQFTYGILHEKDNHDKIKKSAITLDKSNNVDVLGINCSVGPADILSSLIAINGCVNKPVSIMPNAGFPKEVDGRLIYMTSPEYFATYAQRFLEGGASIIGGCCGTTPDHIREAGKAILSLDSVKKQIKIESVPVKRNEQKEMPLNKRSGLGKKLSSGEWITSIELVPPAGTNLSRIIEKSSRLPKDKVTCINIPDGPRASSRISSMITALEIEKKTGMETLLHYCCRDRNLIGMQGDLLGAYAAGLRNILIITGDPPKLGGYPDATGVFDVDSIGLTALVKRLNHGIDLGGNEIPEPTSYVIGVGSNPASPFLEREIDRTIRKKEAGAEFIITQPIFDTEILIEFINKIKITGIPIIAGVWPLASYKNALFLNNEVPGVEIPDKIMKRMEKTESREAAREEGIKIAKEIIKEVKGYIQGIQVSPPFGNIETALKVITD